jgi:hypothetical protein
MIVNNSCNYTFSNNFDFWANSNIINTNVKLDQCVNDVTHDTSHEFKKRLKIKSNRCKRLQYNNEKTEDIKKNYRQDR